MPPAIKDRSTPRFPLLQRLLTIASAVLLVVLAASDLWSWWAPAPSGSLLDLPWMLLNFMAMLTSSFWLYAAIPAMVGLAMAVVWKRRKTAAVLLLALVYASGPWAWSFVRPLAEPSPGSITIMSANVLYSRADTARLDEQISAVDPDVLVFQEVDTIMVDKLAARLSERYPFSVSVPRTDAFGQATFSKLPFVREPRLEVPSISEASGGLPQIVVTVEVGGKTIEIHNVHTLPPITGSFMVRQHRHARAMAEIESDADAVILAGDFNSPERGSVVRLIRAHGYDSVHANRGRGLGSSWPDPERRSKITFLGLRTRIDHLLFAGSLVCTDQGVTEGIGSDHRPVWASFEFSE